MAKLIDLKRDYLKRVVKTMRDRGVLQKELAAQWGDTDASLSGKLSGARGITDEMIDTVQDKTGLPFIVGGGAEGVTNDQIRMLLENVRTQTNLLNAALDEIRALRKHH